MECKLCKKEFIPNHFNQKLCGLDCKLKAIKITKEKHKKSDKWKISNKKWIKSEKRKENEKEYQQKPLAKEKARERQRKRYWENKNNIDFIKRRNEINIKYIKKNYFNYREKNRIATKKYRRTENGKNTNRDHKAKRRTIEKKGKITLSQWKDKMKEFNDKCVYCGASEDIEQDHIIPLSKGGQHCIDNVQPLCKKCNRKKSNKL